MRNKLIFIVCLVLFSPFCLAETCPSVKDIQDNTLKGWTAFDSESGKPLSAQRKADFKKYAEHFVLAEWETKGKQNVVHCYYRDKDGSDLEAYLARDNFIPKIHSAKNNSKDYWYQVSGSMQCAAGTSECAFQKMSDQAQLAEK